MASVNLIHRLESKLDATDTRIKMQTWIIGFAFTVVAVLITLVGLLG